MDSSPLVRAVHSLNRQALFMNAVNSISQAVKHALTSQKNYDCVRVLTLR